MPGFIKLYRGLQNNPLWTSEPFTKGQAWVDLLLSAAYKDSFFMVHGVKVEVKRGQVGMSQLTMSKRWRWSRNKVRRFLDALEHEQMLEQQTNQLTTVVSICNYEEFQSQTKESDTTNETPNGTPNETTNGAHSRSKEGKKVNIKGSDVDFKAEAIGLGISGELWDEFIKNRKRVGASNTPVAMTTLINKLKKYADEGHKPSDLVELANESGWKSVYPPKQAQTNHHHSEPPSDPRRSQVLDRYRQELEKLKT